MRLIHDTLRTADATSWGVAFHTALRAAPRACCIACVLTGLRAAAATPGPKLPAFSWDRLPVFLHTQNSSGPWSEAALQRIGEFPLVTLEKSHNQPAQKAGHRLDKTTGEACVAIHAVAPATKVLGKEHLRPSVEVKPVGWPSKAI